MAVSVFVMETDVRQVAPGTLNGGWVSGSVVGIAPSGNVLSLFDLGSRWDEFTVCKLNLANGPLCTGVSSQVSGRDDPVAAFLSARRFGLIGATSGSGGVFYLTAATNQVVEIIFKPAGRYIAALIINNDNTNATQVGTKATVVAYPC